MNETAVSIIDEYIRDHFFRPSSFWDNYEFEKRSYSQWAAYEILNRIMDHPSKEPIDVIENFMFEMSIYAYCGEDEHRSWIFQTAAETAEELALLFI